MNKPPNQLINHQKHSPGLFNLNKAYSARLVQRTCTRMFKYIYHRLTLQKNRFDFLRVVISRSLLRGCKPTGSRRSNTERLGEVMYCVKNLLERYVDLESLLQRINAQRQSQSQKGRRGAAAPHSCCQTSSIQSASRCAGNTCNLKPRCCPQ